METNDKKWTVYMHTSPSNKRYIGITSQIPEKRWHKDGSGYKEQLYFWRAIQKYGWDNFKHEIIATDKSFNEACEMEKDLIKQYKTYDDKYGYNCTLGGEGRLLTNDQKEQLSQQRQGTHACGYGYFPSDKTKLKMSNAAKNKTFSNETRNKMANAKKKIVYQYDLNGNFINKFNSASEAALNTNTNRGNLCACCRNVVKQANGFFWSYSFINNPELIKKYLDGEIIFSTIKSRNEKKVVQMDLDGNDLKIFNSIKEASEETGISAQEISQACKNPKKITREFKWKFKEDNLYNTFKIIENKNNLNLNKKNKPLVYYRKVSNKWVAYIRNNGKKKTIKTCTTKEDAINAYFEYLNKNKKEC